MLHLQERTRSALRRLHAGVESLTLTDFPDHGNIGDSAIAVGEAAFFAEEGISVRKIYSQPVLPRTVFSSEPVVAIHGGGNLGGLYPGSSRQRNELASRLTSESLLLQEPQSVHFTSDQERRAFSSALGRRNNIRVAVRDEESYRVLESEIETLVLSPDAAHMIGPVRAPAAVQATVFVARLDDETSGLSSPTTTDWPADPVDLAALRWGANRSEQLPLLAPLFRRDPHVWMRRAERRLQRGIGFLARGETVVTDRLHAMIIALHMGRRVIAIDNKIGKLSKYAATWLEDFDDDLTFVTPDEARALATQVQRTVG